MLLRYCQYNIELVKIKFFSTFLKSDFLLQSYISREVCDSQTQVLGRSRGKAGDVHIVESSLTYAVRPE